LSRFVAGFWLVGSLSANPPYSSGFADNRTWNIKSEEDKSTGRYIMLNERFDQVLEQVKTLSPNEQRRLQGVLDEILNQQEETRKMKAFHQALLASGLVKTIKTPSLTSTGERKLIRVQGKPVSETIIEERR
jgi:hypothetical protein